MCRFFCIFARFFMSVYTKIGCVAMLLAASILHARADERRHLCEFGVEGGCGYYMGDAATLPFKNVREMYGAYFRYRFDQRWALQVKGITQRIVGDNPMAAEGEPTSWHNQLINMDVAAEYNFFRFGGKCYDRRVKPFTPYILCGVGVSLHSGFEKIAAYIPFGVGVKWKFAPRFNLQLVWQNNIFFTDHLEGVDALDNTYNLNGSNPLNFDMTSTISLGLTFEFAKERKICALCRQ